MSEENKQVYSPLTNEQIKVKEILLMPIEATKSNSKNRFERKPCKITSQMLYKSPHTKNINPDPDMSDIAIKFYEILYGRTILNKNNGIDDKSFAGDTMNSYNSVAKFASEAKRREWSLRYHCLANFWLIPYSIGRKSKKWSDYDSLDLFLNAIKKNDNRMMTHPYFNYKKFLCETGIFCYGKFLDTHYLTGYTTLVKKEECNEQYKDNSDKIINHMIECIELRADNIVRDEKVCNELYDFFKEKKLL